MNKERLQEIELLALRATPEPKARINKGPSGYWSDVDMENSIVDNYEIWGWDMWAGRKPILNGTLTTEPKGKPVLSPDVLLFEQARELILELIAEIRGEKHA